MSRRLLATGVTGFVGAPCLDALAAAGFDDIHAVVRALPGVPRPGVRWHAADLRDPAAAIRLVREVRPTHLFHAAWIATPGLYLTSPDNRDWAAATIAMARAFAEQGGLRFLGVGSAAEYAATDTPCHEDRTPIAPVSLYGEAKAETWRAVRAIADEYGMPAAWGRLFMPYGPGGPPQRLIPAAIACLRAGRPVPLAAGEAVRDFVFTRDAAHMLAGLMRADATGAFNIGSGEGLSVREVVEALGARLNMMDRLTFTDLPPRASEPQFLVADMSRMAGLGLLARTPMGQALDEILEGASTAASFDQ